MEEIRLELCVICVAVFNIVALCIETMVYGRILFRQTSYLNDNQLVNETELDERFLIDTEEEII